MEGFRVRRVAAPDHLDDVFECEIDEADLAVLRVAQLRLLGLGGVLDVKVQGRRDRDEIAFVVESGVDHAWARRCSRQNCCIGKEAARLREFGVASFSSGMGSRMPSEYLISKATKPFRPWASE
jgi:hypothetical protein